MLPCALCHCSCTHVFQVIISVAQLIGNVWTLSNYRFQESLALINSYATADKSMNVSSRPGADKTQGDTVIGFNPLLHNWAIFIESLTSFSIFI